MNDEYKNLVNIQMDAAEECIPTKPNVDFHGSHIVNMKIVFLYKKASTTNANAQKLMEPKKKKHIPKRA